ncbi:uncharacterized protein C6orf118-like [Chanos chanos]|uniref:Uncharacterized protein C6orf118-like n=1 Tax=Chanos chanos TaxID=29144 RepID=A0A6J2V8K7_CHACN|nr:uncharacterized protein C6orf118 homolog [Chanos chanos]
MPNAQDGEIPNSMCLSTKKGKRTSPRPVLDSTELFLVKPCDKQQVRHSSARQVEQGRYWFTQSHLAGLTWKDQQKMMHQFDRRVLKKQDLISRNCLSGHMLVEGLESKLERELRKLSVQTGVNRDCLGVFRDVFDDVCNASPMFGDILREIKTEYDLYLNATLQSQSSPLDMSIITLLGEPAGAAELEDSAKEVSSLEEEARKALEENDRVRNEFEKAKGSVKESLEKRGGTQSCNLGSHDVSSEDNEEVTSSGLTQGETELSSIDQLQLKTRRMWKVWEEVKRLEEEMKKKMVPSDTVSSTERWIRESEVECSV